MTRLPKVIFLSSLFGVIIFIGSNQELIASHRIFRNIRIKQAVSPKPTPSPTPKISPTLSPTPSPKPTPSPSPETSPSPQATTPSPTYQQKQNYILNAINQYRKDKGLSAVQKDPNTCGFAKIRAKEIVQNFNHDGFRNRVEGKALPYPSYSTVTENIARNSDYKKVVDGWINSSGHAENMRQDTPFVCVEFEGNFYAYEGLRL